MFKMKKSLVAALTGALVVGATATTFAAANPFSDVPAGHWAYNSVTKLANEGVIEGYGDGTFRGNRNITRYEMAQMIARALAKAPSTNMNYATRAELDKLAAEFRDELDSLGVRVAELERNADKVKWTGKLEYTYNQLQIRNKITGEKYKPIGNGAVFRLEPSAEVNDHWRAIARFDANWNAKADSTTDVKLKRAYAEGNYDNFTVRLGRFGYCPDVEEGLVMDSVISGGQVVFGDKWKFTLTAGRIGADSDEAHYFNRVESTVNPWTGNVNVDSVPILTAWSWNAADRLYDSTGLMGTGYLDGVAATDAAWNGTQWVATATSKVPNFETYYIDAADNVTPALSYDARDTLTGNDLVVLGKMGKAVDTLYDAGYNYGVLEAYAAGNPALAHLQGIFRGTQNVDNNTDSIRDFVVNSHPTDVIGLNISYDNGGERGLYGVASYYHAKDADFQNYFYSKNGDTDKASVFGLSLGYRFNDKFNLFGGFARNGKADTEKSAWQVEARYGNYFGGYGEKGSWGIWAGYAKFGYNVAIGSSQGDDVQTGAKGWHIGAAYAPFKNVGLLLRYSDGKYITSGDKYRKFFARAEWNF
jgi:hypothetical protein